MESIFVFLIMLLFLIFIYFVEPLIVKTKIKNNNEHGSARFATKKEIKNNFKKEKVKNIVNSGFPVFYSKNNKYGWFDIKTPHYIYLGSTGSGKSATAVIPECSFIATAKNKKSVFITDPKGEIFNATSLMFQKNGYNVYTLDFRNPELSNHINLLEPAIIEYELYSSNKNKYKNEDDETLKIKYKNESMKHYAQCNQIVNDICIMIMKDDSAKEVFWNNSASDLLYGIIFLFLEDYINGKICREQITLSAMKKFQNSSMANKNIRFLKNYVESKEYGNKCKDKLIPIISTNENTYKSITSVFNERMTLFDDINVENITSNSDFDLDIFGREPTVLYCCIPDETKIYYTLVSMTVSLIYKRLVMLCNSIQDKKLPIELVFLLDEFANTPPLKDIETIVSVARSRGMYFQFFLQSFAQLDNLYGKEVSQIIQDNCGLAYLKTNTQETAEDISLRLGNRGVETTSLNYSTNLINNSGSKGKSLISRRLLTADEIKQLHYKTIIFPTIGHPIFRDTVIYQKLNCYFGGNIDRNERPLKQFDGTYYTVEQLVIDKKNDKAINEELTKILDSVIKIFGNVDFNIEYDETERGVVAKLYLAPPLSLRDLNKLEDKSIELNFEYKVISDKKIIDRDNKNSLIELFLIEENRKNEKGI